MEPRHNSPRNGFGFGNGGGGGGGDMDLGEYLDAVEDGFVKLRPIVVIDPDSGSRSWGGSMGAPSPSHSGSCAASSRAPPIRDDERGGRRRDHHHHHHHHHSQRMGMARGQGRAVRHGDDGEEEHDGDFPTAPMRGERGRFRTAAEAAAAAAAASTGGTVLGELIDTFSFMCAGQAFRCGMVGVRSGASASSSSSSSAAAAAPVRSNLRRRGSGEYIEEYLDKRRRRRPCGSFRKESAVSAAARRATTVSAQDNPKTVTPESHIFPEVIGGVAAVHSSEHASLHERHFFRPVSADEDSMTGKY